MSIKMIEHKREGCKILQLGIIAFLSIGCFSCGGGGGGGTSKDGIGFNSVAQSIAPNSVASSWAAISVSSAESVSSVVSSLTVTPSSLASSLSEASSSSIAPSSSMAPASSLAPSSTVASSSVAASLSASSVSSKASFTISGLVTDAVIPNAEVTARIGGDEFKTTADANGAYALALQLTDEQLSKLVKLIAKGVGAQSNVELISQLGVAADLLQAAGTDKKLSASENFAVNITNVSTAEFSLFGDNLASVTTSKALEDIKAAIDPQQKLDIAAALKTTIDLGVKLPEGSPTTLSLALDRPQLESFIAQIKTSQPETFSQALMETTSDTNLVLSAPATLPSEFVMAFNFENFASGYHFSFSSDGTGTLLTPHGKRAFTWTKSGNKTDLVLATPLRTISSTRAGKSGYLFLDRLSIHLLSTTDSQTLTNVSFHYQFADVNGVSIDAINLYHSQLIAIFTQQSPNLGNLTNQITNTWFDESLFGINFTSSTSGKTFVYGDTTSEKAIQWKLESNLLSVTDTNSSAITRYFIYATNAFGFNVIAVTADRANAKVLVKQQDNATVTSTELLGQYSMQGLSTPTGILETRKNNGNVESIAYSLYKKWEMVNNHSWREWGEVEGDNSVDSCAIESTKPCQKSGVFEYDVIAKTNGALAVASRYLDSSGKTLFQSLGKIELQSLAALDPSLFVNVPSTIYELDNGKPLYWVVWKIDGRYKLFKTFDNTKQRPSSTDTTYDISLEGKTASLVDANSAKRIDVIAADTNGSRFIELCEYSVGTSCAQGKKFKLYRTPRMHIVQTGPGAYTPVYRAVSVQPVSGYKASVSGCEGTFVGNLFTPAKLLDDCVLSINFSPIVAAGNYTLSTSAMTLRDDGTGLINYNGATLPMKWVRSGTKILITLYSQFKTGASIEFTEGVEAYQWLESLSLEVLNPDASGDKQVTLQFNYDYLVNSVSVKKDSTSRATVLKAVSAIQQLNASLFEGTWYANGSTASYKWILSSNGTGKFSILGTTTSGTTNDPITQDINWSYLNNTLQLTGLDNAIKAKINFVKDIQIGYEYFGEINGKLSSSLAVKEQTLSLTEAELFGRWVSQNYAVPDVISVLEFYENHISIQIPNNQEQSWQLLNGRNLESAIYRQASYKSTATCTTSTSQACYLGSKVSRYFIAKSASAYYILSKVDIYNLDGPLSLLYSSYYVSEFKKTDVVAAIPQLLTDFYELTQNNAVVKWSTSGNFLTRTPAFTNLISTTVAGTKIIFKTQTGDTVYDMQALDANSMEFCEYALGQSCLPSSPRHLLKVNPSVSIKVTKGMGSYSGYLNIIAYGSSTPFTALPDAGFKLTNASGCGVVYSGSVNLQTQNVTANCEVSLEFSPL